MNQHTRSLARKVGHIPTGWWVVLLTLPALVPLVRAGFFEAHDGLIHVYRLAALDRAVRAGVLYPRWFPEFAFGYGHPVLNFYGPLSYYWGLPFTLLGGDAVMALKLVFATGLIASALGMYLFARLHLGRGPAVVASIVYAYLPYHLIDLYVRGAVAEFLAFVWLPLVLWAYYRLVEAPSKPGWPGAQMLGRMGLASLLLAALIVTHSLSAFIFAPVLAAYLGILLLKARNRYSSAWVTMSLLLAVTLSTFYWLPVLAESQYVGLGHGTSQGYQDHLVTLTDLFSLSPAYPYPTESGVAPTFPLGLVQVVIFTAALGLIFVIRPRRWVVIFFQAVGLSAAFMLTTASLPVWRLLEPGLALLQYPWRLQALTVLATALLAGALWDVLPRVPRIATWLLAGGCLLLVGAWALWRLPVTSLAADLSVEAMWQRDRDYGQVGATWTGEYLPIWVTEQRWAIARPIPEPTPSNRSLPAGQVRLTGVGYTRYDLTADAPEEMVVTLHQFHFPGWQAEWQGDILPSRPAGRLALATFDVSAGKGSLIARLGNTPARLWGTLISLFASLATAVVLVARSAWPGLRPARGPGSVPAPGYLLLAACAVLLTAVLVASLVLPNGYVRATFQVKANLEDTVELLAFTTDRANYQPGDTAQVTLYWRALDAPSQNLKSFVHLTDAAVTRQPTQHDGDPNGGFTPTTRWLPGELVPDTHPLVLPEDLTPGPYLLWAGMYEYEAVRNLTVVSAEVPVADNRVLLGEIEVVAP